MMVIVSFAASTNVHHWLYVSRTPVIQSGIDLPHGWIHVVTDDPALRLLIVSCRSIPSHFPLMVDVLTHWPVVHLLMAFGDSGVAQIPPHVVV